MKFLQCIRMFLEIFNSKSQDQLAFGFHHFPISFEGNATVVFAVATYVSSSLFKKGHVSAVPAMFSKAVIPCICQVIKICKSKLQLSIISFI